MIFDSYITNEQGQQEIHLFKMRLTHAFEDVMGLLPEGRLKSMFQTKMEEAGFIGVKAVASKPANHTAVNHYTKAGAVTETKGQTRGTAN